MDEAPAKAKAAHLLRVVSKALSPMATMKGVLLTAADLLVWVEALEFHGVSEERFCQAMRVWQMTERFFPMPVEVMELAKGEAGGNRKLVAANELRRLIDVHGPYREVHIEDPVLALTVEQLGGWEMVAETFETSGPQHAAFLRAYENNQRAMPVGAHSNQLAFTPQRHLEFDESDGSAPRLGS